MASDKDNQYDTRDLAARVPGGKYPPNFGQDVVPHVMTFAGVASALSRVYRPSDEALRDSFDNARFMRNDPTVMECVEARQRAVSLLNWHIEPEDQNNQTQKGIAEQIGLLCRSIPRFMQYREQLLHATWYGKAGVSQRWGKKIIRRKMATIPVQTQPINGDKIVFRWDGRQKRYDETNIGIRVGMGFKAGSDFGGFRIEDNRRDTSGVEATEFGLAYFIPKRERPLIALHKHYIEDGEFEDPLTAGRIHGVGIRSRIYWAWFQKQEILAWLMEFLERAASGFEVWYYQWGNPESEAAVRRASQEKIGSRNVIICPYIPDETGRPPYERIEPGMAGADALERIAGEFFGHTIKRYILGQTLTSEQGSTGLGSNLADIHLATFLQIIKYDATLLEETITEELIKPIIRYNFPEWVQYDFQFRIDTESEDAEGKLNACKAGYEMGLEIKAQDIYDLVGLSAPGPNDKVLKLPQQQQPGMNPADPNGQAGSGGMGAGIVQQFQDALAQKGLLGYQPNAGGQPAAQPAEGQPADSQQFAGEDGKRPQDSERVKIRTYGADDPEQYRKPTAGQKSFDWEEDKHPRADDGKFASGGQGTAHHAGGETVKKKHEFRDDDERAQFDEHLERAGKRGIRPMEEQDWLAARRRAAGLSLANDDNKAKEQPNVNLDKTSGDDRGLPAGVGEAGGAAGNGKPAEAGEAVGAGPGSVRDRESEGRGELREQPAGRRDRPARRAKSDDAAVADGGGDSSGGGSRSSGGSGAGGSGTGERSVAPAAPPAPPRPKRPKLSDTDHAKGNWHYTSLNFADGGAKTKFKQNIEAIKVLRSMEAEGREEATPEEKATLSKFVGWGQFPAAFNDYSTDKTPYDEKRRLAEVLTEEEYSNRFDYGAWQKEHEQLESLLSADEFAAARASTLNSHFTAPAVIQAHWKMAERLGFKGGRMLEPSAGSGFYLGMMPESLAKKTAVTAVEKDHVTGKILKALYPSAKTHIKGYEEHGAPDNFYDLTASNVPFGDFKLHDPRYNKHNANIHDYFFLKGADQTKPGGLLMHVTSTGTMDKKDSAIRAKLAKDFDLISAVRFPGGTHKKNAGTEVVTDMLILRKRKAGQGEPPMDHTPDEAQAKEGFTGVTTDSLGRVYHWVNGKRVPGDHWLETSEVPDPAGGDPITVNKYFADRPEQILGTLDRSGTMYRGDSKNVTMTEDFDARLQAAIDRLPPNILNTEETTTDEPQATEAPEGVKDGGFIVQGGQLFQRIGGAQVPIKASADKLARIQGQLAIRDAVNAVIDKETNGEDADSERQTLNFVYDEYVKDHGYLNNKENRAAIKDDPDAPRMLSLEQNWNAKAKSAGKADIFSKPTVRGLGSVTSAKDVVDGLGVTLNERGIVDVAHIAKLTGAEQDDVEAELVHKGIAFEDPAGGWKQSGDYLSGNVKQKLREAKEAAATDPRFKANVEALEKVQPAPLDHTEISAKLGAHWIPAETMNEFAAHLLQGSPEDFHIHYRATDGDWSVNYSQRGENRRLYNSKIAEAWETPRRHFSLLLDAAMNGRPVTVKDKDKDGNSVVNVEATEDAQAKIQQIKEAFGDWIYEDDARREKLVGIYNEQFNDTVDAAYDGSHLTFPGMRSDFTPRAAARNAAWQIITTGKCLMAHEVGLGKTTAMVASAMELRRLGLAKKPAICCLKANIEQMTQEALSLYPGAKVLSTVGAFTEEKRKEMVSRIATGDYDMVFLTHEHLNLLRMKPETEAGYVKEELAELEHAISMSDDKNTIKQLEKKRANLEAKIRKAIDSSGKDDAVYFEDTGIDQLFVDEAHLFKALPIHTSMGNVKGVPTSTSDRASDMLMRSRYIMEKNNGRGVVFATGTPVANTMAELYNMQRYLQPDDLKAKGLHHFDAWANTFGEVSTQMEKRPNGAYEDTTRFRAFVNLPELMSMARKVMDVQRVEDQRKPDGSLAIIRPDRVDTVSTTPRNEAMDAFMASIEARAAKLKGKRVQKGEDNMAVVCGDLKKGGVDLRLVYPGAEDRPDSKINQCVSYAIEHQKNNPGTVQAIFSNVGVHPTEWGFSVFGDIKKKLIASGVKPDEIADFSELENKAKEEAVASIRAGRIKFALGSTQRLGTGVNIQDKLSLIHHLDIPYVPADIEQRDGRGWRFGNFNPTKKIEIRKYVAEHSPDEFLWQLIANKTSFVRQTIKGKDKTLARSVKELDVENLSPDMMMAIASGDPRVMKRIQLSADVESLRKAKDRHEREQIKLKKTYEDTAPRMAEAREQAKKHAADVAHLESRPDFELSIGGKKHADRAEASEALAAATSAHDGKPSYERYNAKHLGRFRGLKLRRHASGSGYTLVGPSGHEYHTGDSIASIEAVARNIPKKIADLDKRQVQIAEDAKNIKGMLGKPFAKAAALKAMNEELKALEAELAPKKKKSEERGDDRPAEEATKYAAAFAAEVQRYIGPTLGARHGR